MMFTPLPQACRIPCGAHDVVITSAVCDLPGVPSTPRSLMSLPLNLVASGPQAGPRTLCPFGRVQIDAMVGHAIVSQCCLNVYAYAEPLDSIVCMLMQNMIQTGEVIVER
jgi:hypothetical protein